MELKSFENLSKKIEVVLEQCDKVKRDKQRIESQMLKKDKESREIKKKLEKALKERNLIKQRLDGLAEKIDSLEPL